MPAVHRRWSASAPANVVAAAEAVLRGRPRTAREPLERGFRRIGAPDDVTGWWALDVHRLAEAGLRPLADRVACRARGRLAGRSRRRPVHRRAGTGGAGRGR
ncbi:hypothetical protein [Streptomyces sp. NPDC052042]|uniref:hypothetical protein n=1 Tax=Streptomyces sp. NPDC052042 TaxID=3365683 RepID=UPI0037D8CF14